MSALLARPRHSLCQPPPPKLTALIINSDCVSRDADPCRVSGWTAHTSRSLASVHSATYTLTYKNLRTADPLLTSFRTLKTVIDKVLNNKLTRDLHMSQAFSYGGQILRKLRTSRRILKDVIPLTMYGIVQTPGNNFKTKLKDLVTCKINLML